MSFVRQFIHYNSSDQMASLKLDYNKRKLFFFPCQNEEQADDRDRTCKARLKDERSRVLEMQNSPHSLVIS